MAEIKFSCPHCGQHISGNEQWSGRQIQCPTCAKALTVPQAPSPPVAFAPVPQAPAAQPPVSHGPRLSAGATQVTRSVAPGTIPRRQPTARPPSNKSPLLKYAVYAIVLAALGGAGYIFLPPLLSKAQDSLNSKPAPAQPASNGGGSGPLGEVNGAMDVSDTLDGGSSATPRPAAVRQPVAAQRPATPAVTSTGRSTNNAARVRHKRPKQTDPASSGQQ
jgi:DNA-directed RNA polymerase subunit RPC12/RpoP